MSSKQMALLMHHFQANMDQYVKRRLIKISSSCFFWGGGEQRASFLILQQAGSWKFEIFCNLSYNFVIHLGDSSLLPCINASCR